MTTINYCKSAWQNVYDENIRYFILSKKNDI